MEATPSYRPPGYPDLGSMWSQPPRPLPGPDNHPFFRWVAEGARMDPEVTATMSRQPPYASPALPARSQPSTPMAVQRQTVYPFVPPPSVAMEPITPNLKPTRSFTRASPSQRTPDLSSSPTEPSPLSAHTTTPVSTGKQPLGKVDTGKTPSPMQGPDDRGENSAPQGGEQPECTSTYIRMVTNPEDAQTEGRSSIVSGQIWRSGSKREGWRRHQWSTEG